MLYYIKNSSFTFITNYADMAKTLSCIYNDIKLKELY